MASLQEIEELFRAKIEREEDTILKQINYRLVCPTCKIPTRMCFNTSEKASEKQIWEWINGQAELFHHNHILNCNGGEKK